MSVFTVLIYPDPRLRTIAKPVEVFDDALKKVAEDMLETMYHDDGVGLAGTQVDYHHRIFVTDCSKTRNEPMVIINPNIVSLEDLVMKEEACLSFPGAYVKVMRAKKIVMKYHDISGNEQEIEATDLLAHCMQHETDHLDGKLMIDYVSALKQKIVRKRVEKAVREQRG